MKPFKENTNRQQFMRMWGNTSLESGCTYKLINPSRIYSHVLETTTKSKSEGCINPSHHTSVFQSNPYQCSSVRGNFSALTANWLSRLWELCSARLSLAFWKAKRNTKYSHHHKGRSQDRSRWLKESSGSSGLAEAPNKLKLFPLWGTRCKHSICTSLGSFISTPEQ